MCIAFYVFKEAATRRVIKRIYKCMVHLALEVFRKNNVLILEYISLIATCVDDKTLLLFLTNLLVGPFSD